MRLYRQNAISAAALRLTICAFITTPTLAFELWPYPYEIAFLAADPAAQMGHVSRFTVELGGSRPPLTARISPERTPLSEYRTAVYFEDRHNNVVTQKNFAWYAWDISGVDIDGDDNNEIVATYAGDTLAGIRMFSSLPQADTLWDYVLLEKDFRWRNRLDKWDVYFEKGPLVTLASTGRKGIVFFCQSGFCQLPRGLIALDANTGQEIWRHWFAAATEQVSVVRLSSGRQILIVSTSSSANGAEWEGTSDTNCYLYAVDMETGTRLWVREFPGPFSRVFFAPVQASSDSPDELVAMFGSSSDANSPAKLMRVIPESGESICELSLPAGVTSGQLFVWEYEPSRWRAYIPRVGNGMLVYDDSFNLIQQRDDVASLLTLGNWEAGPLPELITRSSNGEICYLSDELLLKGRAKFYGYPITEQYFEDSPWPEIWASDGKEEKKFTIRKNEDYWTQIGLRVLVPAVSTIALFWLITWSVRTRRAYVQAQKEKLKMHAWAMSASSLAHDINTPLQVIDGVIQNFTRRLAQSHPEIDTSTFLQKTRRETERFRNTVRQLRVLGKIEKPEFKLRDFSVLLKETVQRLSVVNRGRFDIRVGEPLPLVRIDERLVESLLENLIGNAIQAVDEKCGTVTICLANEQSNETNHKSGLILTIQDDGYGMTPEKLQRIFEPYDSSKAGGTGLGMFRAKEIVEIHHGTIRVQSAKSTGTIVTVWIPADKDLL